MAHPNIIANASYRLSKQLECLDGLRRFMHNCCGPSNNRVRPAVIARSERTITLLDHHSFAEAACAALERLPVI